MKKLITLAVLVTATTSVFASGYTPDELYFDYPIRSEEPRARPRHAIAYYIGEETFDDWHPADPNRSTRECIYGVEQWSPAHMQCIDANTHIPTECFTGDYRINESCWPIDKSLPQVAYLEEECIPCPTDNKCLPTQDGTPRTCQNGCCRRVIGQVALQDRPLGSGPIPCTTSSDCPIDDAAYACYDWECVPTYDTTAPLQSARRLEPNFGQADRAVQQAKRWSSQQLAEANIPQGYVLESDGRMVPADPIATLERSRIQVHPDHAVQEVKRRSLKPMTLPSSESDSQCIDYMMYGRSEDSPCCSSWLCGRDGRCY